MTAVWSSTVDLPAVPIRWVVVRDPQGAFATRALLCTDLGAGPEQILRWFVSCSFSLASVYGRHFQQAVPPTQTKTTVLHPHSCTTSGQCLWRSPEVRYLRI